MNSTHCTDGNAEAQRRDTVCPRSCVCELGSEFWKFDCRVQCSRLCHGCYSVCAQSCPTLCDPSSPPGSSFHGVSQARILEWVALASSRGSSRPGNQIRISCVSCIDRRVPCLGTGGGGQGITSTQASPEGVRSSHYLVPSVSLSLVFQSWRWR